MVQYLACSFWTSAHEEWKAVELDEYVTKIKGNFCDLKPQKVDVVLMDAGESKPGLTAQSKGSLRLLKSARDWIVFNPQAWFCIKVLDPGFGEVLNVLRSIQKVTGKGSFVRAPQSKNTTMELYFVGSRRSEDLAADVVTHLVDLHHRMDEIQQGIYLPNPIIGTGESRRRRDWDPLIHDGLEGLPMLNPLDMTKSLSGSGLLSMRHAS